MTEIKYCKDCKYAKPDRTTVNLWICGKHRKAITINTSNLAMGKDCKNYEVRK